MLEKNTHTSHISDKGLISGLYAEFSKLRSKKKKTLRTWARQEQIFHHKGHTDDKQAHDGPAPSAMRECKSKA